ncbi:hypothetical protein FACS189487_01490 [Campylobacterota bacterium]|nr:hypothetical protein FACS189487_01490 [Campylobacterota bacterium]
MRDENLGENLLVFTDAISAYTHTIESLQAALLFQDQSSTQDALMRPSLLTLLNQAGFATWWISNQTTGNDGLTTTAAISNDAQQSIWLNHARREGNSASYDEALLPALDQALRDPAPNKAIFLHLIRAHLTYALRYPPQDAFFTDQEDIADQSWRGSKGKHYINTYDNAVRYNDKIVSEIIRRAQQEDGQNFVLFFSDHGQEVYDTRPMHGQDAREPTRDMLDIPFMIWFSPEYEYANPAVVAQARLSRGLPFCLNDLTHTAADLARVSFAGFDPRRSLVSAEYAPQPRIMLNGKPYDLLDKK